MKLPIVSRSLAATALVSAALAVGAASTTNVFVAACTPSQELAAVTVGSPPPSCLATFDLTSKTLRYKLLCFNITGVTGAHIHGPATADANGGILVGLYSSAATGAVDGTLARGSIERGVDLADADFDALLDAMRTDKAYVNVHTSANSGGEVRGQIAGIKAAKQTIIDVF
jgi:predicted alpha/beta hydrolase